MKKLVELASTFFYLGYSPVAPGTIGSVPGVLVYLLLKDNFILLTAVIVIAFTAGLYICRAAEKIFGEKDPKKVIYDEFVGMMIALYAAPISLWTVLAGFLLFRFFDIVKPFPIKKVEAFEKGCGVMLDDVIAGLYANICLNILNVFLG